MSKQDIDPKLFERMEAYLMEEMGAQDRAAFESELATDAGLRAELETMRENMLAIGLAGFEREVNRVVEANKGESVERSSWYKPWLRIAAGVALIIGVLAILRSNDPYAQAFAEHYSVDVGLPVTMGVSEDPAFQDAMVDFKSGDYKGASEKWAVLKSQGMASDTLDYFMACSLLELGKDAEARELFNGVKGMPSRYASKAQWYAFLASLRLKDKTSVLAERPIDGSPFTERIQSIQSRLEGR